MIKIEKKKNADEAMASLEKFNNIYVIDKKIRKIKGSYNEEEMLVIIYVKSEFIYMKRIIKKIKYLFDKLYCNVTYYLIGDSKYLSDFIICLEAVDIKDRKSKYEFIYDKVCEYLDEQFITWNHCDFKDNKCTANRNRTTPHKDNGCCYSFDIAGLFSPTLVKNLKLCQYLVNKKCSTKNISCKLHCCKELRKRGISYSSHKILSLECFFTQKQHDIISLNFFRKREEILNKLNEKNYEPYFIYLMRRDYLVR